MLFQPGSELVGIDSAIVQQIDIMPTVLNYLNYDKPYVAFGNDMLDSGDNNFAINYYGNAFQLIMGDWVIQYDLKKVVGFFNLKEDPTMKNNLVNEKLEIQRVMTRKIKAIIQQYNNRMVDNTLTIDSY